MNYGLIGEHLGHSYSKEIHEMFGKYKYELKEIAPENVERFLLAREFKGINVTIPYKQTVIPYLDEIAAAAEQIGAVNTIVNRNGRLIGYNTDFYGMRSLLQSNGFQIAGSKALILGNGGTSKTALAVLQSLGAAEIYKVDRRKAERTEFTAGILTYEEAATLQIDADYIINTTPCGMYPKTDEAPIDLTGFRKLKGVADVIYNPLRTKLLCQASNSDIPAVGGLYMLVAQAVKAAEYFMDAGDHFQTTEEVARNVYLGILRQKENLVLTGMPGSGKSTIGKLLAEKLKKEYVDTDARIVAKEGREIAEIFAHDGEAYFRTVESEVIGELSDRTGLVIATGGGAILRDENVERLKLNGRLIFLNRDPAAIQPTADRPLANSAAAIIARYNERLPRYLATADQSVAVIGTPEDVAAQIINLV